MTELHFNSVINILGVNPYVLVSAEQARLLKPGWKKPLPILLRVNGQPTKPFQTNLMPVGDGSFYLYLHGGMRKISGTKVGDMVTVDLQFDGKYHNGPMHTVPAWFEDALAKNPTASQNWDELSPSRKKEILRYFSQLKSPEAQARNLERAISVLSGNKGRFMARSWG